MLLLGIAFGAGLIVETFTGWGTQLRSWIKSKV